MVPFFLWKHHTGWEWSWVSHQRGRSYIQKKDVSCPHGFFKAGFKLVQTSMVHLDLTLPFVQSDVQNWRYFGCSVKFNRIRNDLYPRLGGMNNEIKMLLRVNNSKIWKWGVIVFTYDTYTHLCYKAWTCTMRGTCSYNEWYTSRHQRCDRLTLCRAR